MTVDPGSHVGFDVVNLGVFDREVVEALLRLLDPGELGIDAGANIGQNTSIMALAAGPAGRVAAFEPQPAALRLLERNVDRWASFELAPIEIVPRALSDREGMAVLCEGADLGGARLESVPPASMAHGGPSGKRFDVEVTTLDAFLPDARPVGLLKIDVEGHEAAVLAGARRLLGAGRVRDVVFEDFDPQPGHPTRILQAAGYAVFGLVSTWSRPSLVALSDCGRRRGHRPSNFVATRDPARAIARLERRGWSCLRIEARARGDR